MAVATSPKCTPPYSPPPGAAPGADSVKAKAAITWVGVSDDVQAEVRICDRLFLDAQPDAGGIY